MRSFLFVLSLMIYINRQKAQPLFRDFGPTDLGPVDGLPLGDPLLELDPLSRRGRRPPRLETSRDRLGPPDRLLDPFDPLERRRRPSRRRSRLDTLDRPRDLGLIDLPRDSRTIDRSLDLIPVDLRRDSRGLDRSPDLIPVDLPPDIRPRDRRPRIRDPFRPSDRLRSRTRDRDPLDLSDGRISRRRDLDRRRRPSRRLPDPYEPLPLDRSSSRGRLSELRNGLDRRTSSRSLRDPYDPLDRQLEGLSRVRDRQLRRPTDTRSSRNQLGLRGGRRPLSSRSTTRTFGRRVTLRPDQVFSGGHNNRLQRPAGIIQTGRQSHTSDLNYQVNNVPNTGQNLLHDPNQIAQGQFPRSPAQPVGPAKDPFHYDANLRPINQNRRPPQQQFNSARGQINTLSSNNRRFNNQISGPMSVTRPARNQARFHGSSQQLTFQSVNSGRRPDVVVAHKQPSVPQQPLVYAKPNDNNINRQPTPLNTGNPQRVTSSASVLTDMNNAVNLSPFNFGSSSNIPNTKASAPKTAISTSDLNRKSATSANIPITNSANIPAAKSVNRSVKNTANTPANRRQIGIGQIELQQQVMENIGVEIPNSQKLANEQQLGSENKGIGERSIEEMLNEQPIQSLQGKTTPAYELIFLNINDSSLPSNSGGSVSSGLSPDLLGAVGKAVNSNVAVSATGSQGQSHGSNLLQDFNNLSSADKQKLLSMLTSESGGSNPPTQSLDAFAQTLGAPAQSLSAATDPLSALTQLLSPQTQLLPAQSSSSQQQALPNLAQSNGLSQLLNTALLQSSEGLENLSRLQSARGQGLFGGGSQLSMRDLLLLDGL